MKKAVSLILSAVMAVGLFAGCGKGAGNTTDANTIRIGMSGPLTGSNAQYGTAVKAGMEIAVEEINAKGGLQIAFYSEDDEADGEKAVSAYNTLKDKNIQFLAGAVTTGSCNAVAPLTAEDNIVMMTPSGSAEAIAMAGKNVYQMCFTDPNQGVSAAQLVAEKNMGKAIGIIYDSSDAYSTGIAEGFKAKAATLGLNIVCETSFTNDSKSDLSTQVTKCQEMGADLVFLPFYYSEAARVLTYANKIGYKPTFFGCDGMDGILNVEGFDKSLAEGLALMTPFDADGTDEATVSFITKYKEKRNGLVPNQFAADGYDVIYALYEACEKAGVNGATSNEEACRLVEEQLNAMTFNGLTGKGMQWDDNGMISKLPAAVVITNGAYVPMA